MLPRGSRERRVIMERVLRLSPLRLVLLVIAWLAAAAAHNIIYGLLYERFPAGWDEPVFFALATIVLPAYLLVSGLYTLTAMIRDVRAATQGDG